MVSHTLSNFDIAGSETTGHAEIICPRNNARALARRRSIAMKCIAIFTSLLFAATTLLAQQPPSGPPLSPLVTESGAIGGKAIAITYCSPRVRGRKGHIFTENGLISHDRTYPVWRAGANAATALHTDAAISLGKLSVPPGDYTLFVDISEPTQWTLIVSKETGEWGLDYDKTKDLGRVKLKMRSPSEPIEDLKYTIKDDGDGRGTLTLAWEDISASVPILVVH
jgi:hypothetical protein